MNCQVLLRIQQSTFILTMKYIIWEEAMKTRLEKPTWGLSVISIYENTAAHKLEQHHLGSLMKVKCKPFFIKNKRPLDSNFLLIPI